MQYYSCPYIIHECSEKILNLVNYGSINILSHYTILCNPCLQVCAEKFQNIIPDVTDIGNSRDPPDLKTMDKYLLHD